jgi:hypothetical protein
LGDKATHWGVNEGTSNANDRDNMELIEQNGGSNENSFEKDKSRVKRGISKTVNELGVEVKFLSRAQPLDIILVFEGVPIWLLALEPSRVRDIVIVGHDSRSSLMSGLTSK